MHLYRFHGATVASDLQLHVPQAGGSLAPDMVLRRAPQGMDVGWEPEPEDLLARVCDETRQVRYVAGRTQQGYRLRFVDLCEFDLSSDLSRATWTAVPGGDPGLVSVLAAGAFMAFRLTMAGHLVLHASAVRVCGRGLAFVGASGMGKSTMATLMCADGARLLTDDVARVSMDGGDALLWPGAVESRLRSAAAPLVELLGSSTTRRTSDNRTAVTLPCSTDGAVALDAVVIPKPSRDRVELEVSALSPAQALILLGRFPRIPGWVDAQILDHQFHLLADLVERVPTYLAVVPWGPPFTVGTAAGLLDAVGWSPTVLVPEAAT